MPLSVRAETQAVEAHAQEHTPRTGGCAIGAQPCGARTRKGTSCVNPAMPNGRCRMHGGGALRGPAHPNYRDGSTSRYLPAGPIADAYAQMDVDRAQLHDLTDDIRVLRGFRDYALSQLATADVGALVRMVREIAEALVDEHEPMQPANASAALTQACTDAVNTEAAMRKATAAIHDRARIVETDLRSQTTHDRLVTREAAIAFGFALVDAVRSKFEELGADPSAYEWLRDQAQRAAVRHILGADPDDNAASNAR